MANLREIQEFVATKCCSDKYRKNAEELNFTDADYLNCLGMPDLRMIMKALGSIYAVTGNGTFLKYDESYKIYKPLQIYNLIGNHDQMMNIVHKLSKPLLPKNSKLTKMQVTELRWNIDKLNLGEQSEEVQLRIAELLGFIL